MAQTPFISPKVISDLVKHESSEQFNRESNTVKTIAATAVDIDEALGQPVKVDGTGFIFVAAADIANATGFVGETDNLEMIANATKVMTVFSLAAGCVVNSSALPATDAAGAAITLSAYIARLKVLGYRVVSDPAETTTQTT